MNTAEGDCNHEQTARADFERSIYKQAEAEDATEMARRGAEPEWHCPYCGDSFGLPWTHHGAVDPTTGYCDQVECCSLCLTEAINA